MPGAGDKLPAFASSRDDEVYPMNAHILHLNGIIGGTHARTLQQVRMPNETVH